MGLMPTPFRSLSGCAVLRVTANGLLVLKPGTFPTGQGYQRGSLRLCRWMSRMYRDRREPLALRRDAQQFSFEVPLEGLWILRCGGPVVRAGPPPQVGSPLASRISTLSDDDV